MTCRSALGLRTLATVLLPALLGGCACFTPVLKAADAALTAAMPTAAPAAAVAAPKSPARVKGFSRTAAKAEIRPRRAIAAQEPRPKPPRAVTRDTAIAADEADAAAVAAEAERLALAETAARAASEKAVADAHALMLKGEVQAARQRLVAAMNGSNALVVLALARTFDPGELDKLGKADAQPDAARAKALYEHALQLGAKDAALALKRLAATQPKAPPPVPTGAQPVQGRGASPGR